MKKKKNSNTTRLAVTQLFNSTTVKSTLPIVWNEPKIRQISNLLEANPNHFTFEHLEEQIKEEFSSSEQKT